MKLALSKVLITGGTRGIGRSLAQALVLEGCEVMVCGRDADGLRAAREELGVRAVRCDLLRPEDRANLVAAVRGEFAGLDLLINNAGLQVECDVTAGLEPRRVDAELALNLAAPIHLTAEMLPLLMSSPAGVVANVTSALSLAPSPRSPVYSAAKAGLAAWTRALRLQLAESGVRVVEIIPPLVATDMTAGRQQGAIAPEDVARAVVAGFAADEARIVIGKARILARIHRLSPALAARIMARQ